MALPLQPLAQVLAFFGIGAASGKGAFGLGAAIFDIFAIFTIGAGADIAADISGILTGTGIGTGSSLFAIGNDISGAGGGPVAKDGGGGAIAAIRGGGGRATAGGGGGAIASTLVFNCFGGREKGLCIVRIPLLA